MAQGNPEPRRLRTLLRDTGVDRRERHLFATLRICHGTSARWFGKRYQPAGARSHRYRMEAWGHDGEIFDVIKNGFRRIYMEPLEIGSRTRVLK